MAKTLTDADRRYLSRLEVLHGITVNRLLGGTCGMTDFRNGVIEASFEDYNYWKEVARVTEDPEATEKAEKAFRRWIEKSGG